MTQVRALQPNLRLLISCHTNGVGLGSDSKDHPFSFCLLCLHCRSLLLSGFLAGCGDTPDLFMTDLFIYHSPCLQPDAVPRDRMKVHSFATENPISDVPPLRDGENTRKRNEGGDSSGSPSLLQDAPLLCSLVAFS